MKIKNSLLSWAASSLLSLLMIPSPIRATPVRGIAGDLWADVVVGKAAFTDDTENATDGTRLFNVGGVLVDRVNNRLFVFDSGNNRVLVVNSLANLQEGVTADFALGQPTLLNSAGNGDSNFQNYPNPAVPKANSLLTLAQGQISTTEGGSFATMAVDSQGNLYVPDFFNNRVLRYNAPFSANESASGEWGQPDFSSGLCNQGASAPTSTCLCLNEGGNDDYGAGVAVDPQNNLWVVDAGNNRVLRFPYNSSTGMPAAAADQVLGQSDFVSNQAATGSGDWNHLRTPKSVRVDNAGKVYVADIPLANPFPTPPYQDCDRYDARVLEFAPPIPTVGATAVSMLKTGLVNPGGLEFDTATNGIWVDDFCTEQAELFVNGVVTKVLGQDHPSTVRGCVGVTFIPSGPPFHYDDGTDLQSDTICGVSGGMGVDSQGNVFIASVNAQDVWRFPNPIPTYRPGTGYSADIRVFKGHQYGVANNVSLSGLGNPFSLAVVGTQLIVADGSRILYWNGAPNLAVGQQATGYAGVTNPNLLYPNGMGMIQGDTNGHLWTLRGTSNGYSAIEVYNVPFTASGTMPFTSIVPPLPVLGQSGVSLAWANLAGIAPDPAGNLWVSDNTNNRVLRIRNPLTNPVVDIVLGQPNVTSTGCNQRGAQISQLQPPNLYCGPCLEPTLTATVPPTASTLYMPGPMRFDHHGDLFVSDNSLECWGNHRLLRWNASQLPTAQTSCTFAIPATFVYGTNGSFTTSSCASESGGICKAWEPAFTSDDSIMVVGMNPNDTTDVNGLERFPLYLTNPRQGDTPAGHLMDFTSMPIGAEFDSNDNLYMTDENRNRVLIYLKPFATGATFTPTPTISPSPTVGTGCGTSSVSLQLKEYSSLNGNQASENFEVINSGSTPLNLSQITVKFWIDDTTGQSLVGAVNYGGCYGSTCTAVSGVAISSSSFSPVCGPDGTHQANWETTLSTTDSGTLGAGVTWANVQTALHLANYGAFSNTSSWYSPASVGSGNSYTNDLHYAVYYQGNLVTTSGGVPPSCRAAATCTPGGQTGTPTATPSWTSTATISPTLSATASRTSTSTPTGTVSATFTNTPAITSTATSTRSATSSPSATVSRTNTSTPTQTWTSTPTPAVSSTRTPTFSPTISPTATRSATATFTSTPSPTAALSPMPTPTSGSASLRLQFKAGNTADPTNNPGPQLMLFNDGTTAVDLTQVEVRYWYTEEGTQAQQVVVDWAGRQPSGTSITSFLSPSIQSTTMGGQTNYVRYLFNSGVGVLNPGEDIEIQSRFDKTDWSNYTQSNDWSYTPFTSFANWTQVTAYLNGVKVWGQEPGGPAPMRAALVRGQSTASASRVVPLVVAAPNVSTNGRPIQFRVTLSQAVPIQLTLFSLTGEKVAGLSAEGQSGLTNLTWDLTNDMGEQAASGLYLYVLRAGNLVQTGKVALIH